MPELHIVGEIAGASEFKKRNLFCKWELLTSSDKWTELDGSFQGQTQLSLAKGLQEGFVSLNHPFDAYYSSRSIHGWPKLSLEVWHEDVFGRSELSGYGMVHIPTAPGAHELDCVVWRPQGTLSERIFNYFFDTTAHLDHKEVVHNTNDRFDLVTETMGVVHLKIEILQRGFSTKGVEFLDG